MAATDVVTLRLPPALRKRLDRLAKSTARSRAWLAAEAIEKYLETNEWQVEAIEQGIRAADEGDLHRHEDVKAWVRSWGTRRELKRPR
jgi:RHH-type transcriptional regulator, rel operon repressor / antitoxin RelB